MRFVPLSFAILAALCASSALSAVPKKPPLSRYTQLWTDSPITNPEVVIIDKTPPPNPLEEYTLASLCKIQPGWHVILLHKKDRAKRIRLTSSGINKSNFKIVSVENPASRKARVEIEADGQKGWVQFEPKFLTLRKAAPTPQAKLASASKPTNIRRKPVPTKR